MIRIADHCKNKSIAEGLTVARDLLLRGYVSSAGCLARSALELHLRRLCTWHGCEPTSSRALLRMYVERLSDKRIVDRQTEWGIRRAAKVGNRCAHGRAVEWHEVSGMLNTVRDLLATHPVDEEAADDLEGWQCG